MSGLQLIINMCRVWRFQRNKRATNGNTAVIRLVKANRSGKEVCTIKPYGFRLKSSTIAAKLRIRLSIPSISRFARALNCGANKE